jgi:hypothetical protein
MPVLPFDPSRKYFAIIGCGFSAITNHVVLTHSVSPRLSGLDVLHIGSQDPWRQYYPMPMGQWPTLLSLPGFHNRPKLIARCDNLGSDEFAEVNEQEWMRLSARSTFYHLDARVKAIRNTAP